MYAVLSWNSEKNDNEETAANRIEVYNKETKAACRLL